jgi:succinate-semialdehyde dehydrogenase/glutarate-semialdehyde dehydrogenase
MSADAVSGRRPKAGVDTRTAGPPPQHSGNGPQCVIPPETVERLLRHAVVGTAAELHVTLAPFTGEPVATLPLSTEGDVAAAFATAAAAQQDWARAAPRSRAAVLLRFHDLLIARQEQGLDLAQIETGKARRDAFEELMDCALNARHYARDGPGLLALAALLAGNAVVLRPDLQTTLTALWTVDLLHAAGLPTGLLPVVVGDGARVGPWVIDRADYVMFTGSTRVGREVAARCGERLIGCSLELGGKNPMIVRTDADIERSAEIAVRGCFANAGQLCIGIERLYVHHDIEQAFLAAFLRRVNGLRLQPGIGWGAGMGTMISAKQRDAALRHIDDAVAKGARILTGGHARPDLGPYYLAPTVLRGVTEDMLMYHDETFGPVVSVATFTSEDEVIALANDSEFGLNAAVLTRDTVTGEAMARRIQAGTVNVNEAYGSTWGSTSAPMGGMKASGLGRRHGVEGLLKYTEPQTVSTQRLLGLGAPAGRSDEQWARILTRAVRAMKRLGVR